MARSHTIFVLKPDALKRGLETDIVAALGKHFDIVRTVSVVLTRENVFNLKKDEWKYNWDTYPTDEIIEFTYAYEAGSVIVVLAKCRDEVDAFLLGRHVKGNRHLAHECLPSTIRGTFYDRDVANSVRLYYGKVSMVFDGNVPIALPPNLIHSVDNEQEFRYLFQLAFKDEDLSLAVS